MAVVSRLPMLPKAFNLSFASTFRVMSSFFVFSLAPTNQGYTPTLRCDEDNFICERSGWLFPVSRGTVDGFGRHVGDKFNSTAESLDGEENDISWLTQ